ncbi:MAG: diiron oxygenase, partial [Mycobacterium sp.]
MNQKTARAATVRRRRHNTDVLDDTQYVDMLAALSQASVRRNFNPYIDID